MISGPQILTSGPTVKTADGECSQDGCHCGAVEHDSVPREFLIPGHAQQRNRDEGHDDHALVFLDEIHFLAPLGLENRLCRVKESRPDSILR